MKWGDSLWDIEQKEKRRQEEIDRIKNVVGRDYHLPARLKGRKMKIRQIDKPESILFSLGYIKFFDNGFTKQIDKKKRFHAKITQDRKYIYLHTDIFISRKRHKASEDGVEEEIEKMRIIRDKMAQKITPKTPKVKPEKLSEEEKRKALQRLWEENHPVKAIYNL